MEEAGLGEDHIQQDKPEKTEVRHKRDYIPAIFVGILLLLLCGFLVNWWVNTARPALLNIERKAAEDLLFTLHLIGEEDANADKLKEREVSAKTGNEFYRWAGSAGLLSSSGDGCSERLSAKNWRYTSPTAGELLTVLASEPRTIVFTWNTENWNTGGDKGVLVAWSGADNHVVEFMTFETAKKDWGITEAEWADPAGKLFGKKAPFQHTYE